MRGRILWASVLAVAFVAACSKKDSLYIDSSKDGQPPAEAAAQPANKAAPEPRKTAEGGAPAPAKP